MKENIRAVVPREKPTEWNIPRRRYCPGGHQETGLSIDCEMSFGSGMRTVFQVPPSWKLNQAGRAIAASKPIRGGMINSPKHKPSNAGSSAVRRTALGIFSGGGSLSCERGGLVLLATIPHFFKSFWFKVMTGIHLCHCGHKVGGLLCRLRAGQFRNRDWPSSTLGAAK